MSTAASNEEPTPTTALRNSRAPSCSRASFDVASASTRGKRPANAWTVVGLFSTARIS